MSRPSLIETRARTSCRKFAPPTFWRVTTEKLWKRRPVGFNLAKHWDHVAILQENKDELYLTIRPDDADGALSLEEQASLTYNQVTIKKTGSIYVLNKHVLIHFILKHGQVSANIDLLLKRFAVFGRDTPTGTKLKAQYQSCHCTSQESPPNRSVVDLWGGDTGVERLAQVRGAGSCQGHEGPIGLRKETKSDSKSETLFAIRWSYISLS